MKPSRFGSLMMGSAAAIGLMASAGSARADDVSDLRKQIEVMQEKIAKLEATKAAEKRKVAAAAAVEAGDKPRSWKLPGTNTSIVIGGYVKADVTWDFGARGFLTTGVGPNNGNNAANNATNGGSWQFSARESRFYIRTWTPTDWGELTTHLEADFYGGDTTPNFQVAGAPLGAGSSSGEIAPNLRLRHAYGTLGPVLAGQTWTTWMPVWAGAELLDFGGAASAIFVRQTQIRYTHSFGGGFFMDFSIENPIRRGLPSVFNGWSQSSGNGPTFVNATSGTTNGSNGANPMPDFVVTAYYNMPRGRIWVGGLLRRLNYDTGCGGAVVAATPPNVVGTCSTGGGADSTLGWGIAVAGAFRITKKIRMGFQGVYGRGVYSYFNGSSPDAVVNPTANGQGQLEAVPVYGGYIWGQYRWTDTIRSTVLWSYFKVDINDAINVAGVNANQWVSATGQRTESIHQAFVNLIWSPVPQVNIGIEYSWYQNNLYGGANFTGNRVHIAFQYQF